MTRRGFSLIELVVVIAILGLLVGLVLAGTAAVRQAAARAQCQARLAQLSMACHGYAAIHGTLPSGITYPYATTDREHPGISWPSLLLPHLEQAPLWAEVEAAHRFDPTATTTERHIRIAERSLSVFRCPADPRPFGSNPFIPAERGEALPWGLLNYPGVAGTRLQANNGVFHPSLRVTLLSITDGTSNTLMIGERPSGPHGFDSAWYANWAMLSPFPAQLLPVTRGVIKASSDVARCSPPPSAFFRGTPDDACDVGHHWSMHSGGSNFAFADGHVRFLRYSAADILPALATRAGGETVSVE